MSQYVTPANVLDIAALQGLLPAANQLYKELFDYCKQVIRGSDEFVCVLFEAHGGPKVQRRDVSVQVDMVMNQTYSDMEQPLGSSNSPTVECGMEVGSHGM